MDREIQDAVEELLENPSTPASSDSLEDILARLEKIAAADIRHAYNPDGTLKSPTEWPDDFALAVERVGNQGGAINSVSLVPRGKTLESLARIKGAFDKESEVTPFEKLLAQIPRDDLKQLLEALLHLARQRGLETREQQQPDSFRPETEIEKIVESVVDTPEFQDETPAPPPENEVRF